MHLLLDTNIIIDWYTNGPSVNYIEEHIERGDVVLSTSIICAIEFLIKAQETEYKSFCALVDKGEILLYSFAGCDSAIQIADIQKKTGLKLPDSIIVYIAKKNNCILVTRDGELFNKGNIACNMEFIQT